jgi:hypothetical protein
MLETIRHQVNEKRSPITLSDGRIIGYEVTRYVTYKCTFFDFGGGETKENTDVSRRMEVTANLTDGSYDKNGS